jgi:hypothetical protein
VTLTSLAALAPTALLTALPQQVKAMCGNSSSNGGGGGSTIVISGSLGAALTATRYLSAVAADRSSLLVSQSLRTAVAAVVATSGAAAPPEAAQQQQDQPLRGWSHAAAQWLERAAGEADSGNALTAIDQLLPSRSGNGGRKEAGLQQGPQAATDGAVLLWRLRRLAAFEASEEFKGLVGRVHQVDSAQV